ncbi:hypothetical protein [Butyrivibrio sp. JL13D10]|uniref:hypothetical protein n=1 Tax=Butyrivibrio sp. JL13D10 TaxID=3236815 RepID=UPI0038B5DC31
MTKTEFLNTLLAEGFTCEKSGAYPSVVCDAKDVKKTAKRVRDIAKKSGYDQSFAIRSYREGMDLITKDGAVIKSMPSSDIATENEENVAEIESPIPMIASEGESA